MNLYDIVAPMTMAEAKTDYEKRRQRERDVDAGKPVAKQRQPRMTDYQKRRAQQKKEMELGENAWHSDEVGNSWSDGQGQWSSENNQVSSSNNPMGFTAEDQQEADSSNVFTVARLVQGQPVPMAGYPTQQQALAIAKQLKAKYPSEQFTIMSEPGYQDNDEEGLEMDEGYQDFNKVEPYAVCLAGKPVKQFDYYEEARRFHDNWKQKLYREGDKVKADKITLMPMNLKEFAPSPDYNGGGEPDRFPRIPQKFHKGDVVWVSAAKSKMRSHFPGNCPAVVLGSYDDQYGDDMVYVDVDLDDPDLSAEDREYYINDAKRKAAEEHQYDIYLLHNREVGETAWYPESGMTAVPAGTNVEQLFTKGDAVPYAKVPAKIKKIIANKLGQQGVAEGDKYEPAPDLISLDSIPGLNHGGLPKAKTRLGQGGNVGIQAPDKTKTRGQVNNFKDRLKQKLGMGEDANDTYNIIRTNGHGKKDVFAGNYSLEQAKDELAKCLAHPLHTKYGHKFAIVKRKEQGVAETDETSWTANSAQFRKEEDLSWPVEITLEPKDDINRGRGAQVKTMTVTGQSRDAAKKKLVDYYRKNGWAVTGIKFTGDLDEGSFAHDQLKGEINDLFKPVVLQIVKWARAEGMTAKDLAGTSSHFFLDALDPDTYDRTQHLPDNYFNKLMDKANAKAVEILKKKGVAESTNYWTRLQNQRNTKLNTLVNELKESIKK